MSFKFVNLTPHTINVEGMDPIPSSGSLRAAEIVSEPETFSGATIVNTSFGPLEGPETNPIADTYYIVSPFVATHPDLKGRKDIVCPDTGPASVIRFTEANEEAGLGKAGQIKAVKRLRRLL
jgi:hypothetical protein